MMRSTEQREIFQPGRPTVCPVDQVMPITPDRRPIAAIEDAVMVACCQRPTSGGRDRPAGVADLMFQPGAEDPRDRRVAGMPANGLGGDDAAPSISPAGDPADLVRVA